MAKNVVFLIHGIGTHPEGWSQADDGPVKALSKAAEYYSDFSEQEPISGAIEFVEIRYDDIFDGVTFPKPANYGPEGAKHLCEQAKSGRQAQRMFSSWNEDKFQESTSKYYRLIYGIDVAVGMIVDELKAQNLADNTVISITGCKRPIEARDLLCTYSGFDNVFPLINSGTGEVWTIVDLLIEGLKTGVPYDATRQDIIDINDTPVWPETTFIQPVHGVQ